MKPSKRIITFALAGALGLSGATLTNAQQPGAPDQSYAAGPPPSQLMMPAGSWVSVSVDNELSSDRSRSGDGFTATLTQPLVVNGLVVARRGQMVEGRVAEAIPAGRGSGTSRLSLEITGIGLVDGQQLPVQTQLIEYRGPSSVGQDAATIAATTGIGAAIGAAADGGFGAGMGAIAGAAASTIGVLVTRGRPTVIYPESVITFRTMVPITVFTGQSYMAFQPVTAADYQDQGRLQRRVSVPAPAPRVAYGPYYGPYRPYYGYGYGYRYDYGYPYAYYAPIVPRVVVVPRAVVVRPRPFVVVNPRPRVVVSPRRVVVNRGGGRHRR